MQKKIVDIKFWQDGDDFIHNTVTCEVSYIELPDDETQSEILKDTFAEDGQTV